MRKDKVYNSILCLLLLTTFLGCNQPNKKQNQDFISKNMKQVLIIGMDPKTVDFNKPGFEPGLTAEIVSANIKDELKTMADVGIKADILFLYPDSINMSAISAKLKSSSYDGVLIGYGIRLSPANFLLFEKLVNKIHQDLPDAKIIFNNDSKATDMLESIQRWL